MQKLDKFKNNNIKSNLSSGLVVYLVALPLCLGIAVASGAPPLAGIISGIIGGIIVGTISNSHISVSGPAAGLTAILITGISELGSFELILLAGVIAGIIQVILGFIKAGAISRLFPSNVIEGMLGGIGIIIILKQINYALGITTESDSLNVISGTADYIKTFINNINLGSLLITIISGAILLSKDKIKFLNKIKAISAALIAVAVGIAINDIFIRTESPLIQNESLLVSIPIAKNISEFGSMFTFPDFNGFLNSQVWVTGITIAIVASIETLLCIDAADKMDHLKRITDTNRELKAQGIGNVISSLIGGLPMTSVVVRSSANAKAGATSKLSAVIHGVFLLLSIIILPTIINMIPMATLAAILILVGYKLARPSIFIHFWKKGIVSFIPFITTLLCVAFIDLLSGVAIGIIIYLILKCFTDKETIINKLRLIFFMLRRA